MKSFHVHCNQDNNAEVSENGIDWKEVSKEEFEKIINALKENKDNVIIYSRDNPFEDASDETLQIFSVVESARLPIKLVKNKGSDGSGESEPDNEPSYTNCLLVMLAKSPGRTVVLTSGQPVPDIESISTNQNELPWIRGLPFNYNQLNTDIVINTLLAIAKKPILNLFSKNLEISARMVLSEGKSEMVRFQIKQKNLQDKSQQLEVCRI